jgi:hypothetical protein
MLPWVRFELVTFSAAMALYALATEADRRMLIGMAVFPFAYINIGALYHHDVLWIAHFPPSLSVDPDNPVYADQLMGLGYLLEPALALTPVAALAAAVSFAQLQRLERVLLAYATVTAVVLEVLPIFRIGNFGTSPRYLLLLLPILALLVERALERWWEGTRPSLAALLGTMLVGLWVATRQLDWRATEIVIVAYALVLAAAWLRAGTLAAALALALLLTGPLLPVRTDLERPPYLDPILAWLKAHPELSADPIYTNAQLLAPFLERRLPGTDVCHVAGPDMARELTMETNPVNGQGDRIRRLCALDLYGKTVFPPITPENLPGNALLVLRDDVRLPLILPAATWSPRLEVLVETPDYQIARLRTDTTDAAHPWAPDWTSRPAAPP